MAGVKKSGRSPAKAEKAKASRPGKRVAASANVGGRKAARSGKPKVKVGKPKAKAGKPKVSAGEPKAKGGKPKAKAWKLKVSAGKPKAKTGKSKVSAGKPKAKTGEPKAKAGKPQVKAGRAKAARAAPAPARTILRIRELDPHRKCGPGTTVERLIRVDEQVDRRLEAHLVFLDRHGWYCEHGPGCHAVGHARKHRQ